MTQYPIYSKDFERLDAYGTFPSGLLTELYERNDLEFYNCIFDHDAGKFDKLKPHKHTVATAWNVYIGNDVRDGIAFVDKENRRFFCGCVLKDFDLKPNSTL